MKIFLPLLISLFINASLNAQPLFNRAFHNKNEIANPYLIEINNDLYFTTSDYPVGSGFSHLYRIGLNGTIKSITQISMSRVGQIIKTNDNKLVAVGYDYPCDVGMPNPCKICKLDTNGTQLFFTSYSLTISFTTPDRIIQLPDSSYLSFASNEVTSHGKNGQLISNSNTGLTEISSVILLQNNHLLISAKLNCNISIIEYCFL
jgi:hypothetical protein